MRHLHALFLVSLLVAPVAGQRLIGIDSNRSVFDIDMTTGARLPLGAISANAGTTGGLAYDIGTGRLWVTSTSLHEIYTLDVTNWVATPLGGFGLANPFMHGVEWDSSTQTLYGYAAGGPVNGLYTIDQTTGTATFVGATGIGGTATSFHNLGHDPIQNVMWMTNSTTDSFYSIDRATGAATLVGPLTGPTNPNGLAYSIETLTLFLVCNNTDALYSIDTTTGAATVIGPMGTSNMLGLVYIPGTGRLTRDTHACGPTTIRVTGHPAIGSPITTELGSLTGIPLVGYGVVATALPFCGCTIGHEWAAATVGATSTFPLPSNPALVGVQLLIQGTDFLGTGGCASPQLTLTDTITVTIG
jgi:hypothetical protein